MKHIFIINPAAGKRKKTISFIPEIEETCKRNSLDYEIYITTEKLDGFEFVKEKAQSGEDIRFYACGGDGTLFEVVNGSFGFNNVQVTVVPLGSGNDFIRFFGNKSDFLNLENLIKGNPIEVDLIKCGDKYAINQCCMGLDAEIGGKHEKFKKLPFITGEAAYFPAIIYGLMRKIKNVFTIRIDEGEPFTQPCLFCVIANSRWYGGGYFSAPKAIPTDGLLDFVIIKKTLSRFQLLPLIKKYKQGKHLEWDFTIYERGKKISIHSEKPAAVNMDGEVFYMQKASFEIVEKGISFVVPAGANYNT